MILRLGRDQGPGTLAQRYAGKDTAYYFEISPHFAAIIHAVWVNTNGVFWLRACALLKLRYVTRGRALESRLQSEASTPRWYS